MIAQVTRRLPGGWRRWPSAELERLLDTLDDSTFEWEDVQYELDQRESELAY